MGGLQPNRRPHMLTRESSGVVIPLNYSRAPRRTASEILASFRLPSPPNGKSRYYAACPQCSAQRSTLAHRKAPVLGITIDNEGVKFGCNHCGWTGGGYYETTEKQFPQQQPFVAVYDYVDESGNLLFQVCRKANKEFPQRRPTSNGG